MIPFVNNWWVKTSVFKRHSTNVVEQFHVWDHDCCCVDHRI